MRGRKKLFFVAAVVLAIAVVLRVAAPFLVEQYVNRTLAGLENYSGHVASVDLAIWRGSYSLESLRIHKLGKSTSHPFVSVPRMNMSIEWGALLRGELVAEVQALEPRLVFIDAETEEQSQTGLGPEWADKLKALAPFRFNKVTIERGRLEFRNAGSQPPVELFVGGIEILAENLTNVRRRQSDVFATVAARGLVMGETPVSVNARFDPIVDPPEIELDAELEAIPLSELNPLLNSYANVDAEAGTFSVYVEIATADGRFEGYVKPLLEDADFVRLEEDDSIFRKAWETIVGLTAELFENQPKDRFATRIPLSGELEAVNVEIVPAIFSILKNAFIQALGAGISGTVGIKDLEESLQNDDQGRSGEDQAAVDGRPDRALEIALSDGAESVGVLLRRRRNGPPVSEVVERTHFPLPFVVAGLRPVVLVEAWCAFQALPGFVEHERVIFSIGSHRLKRDSKQLVADSHDAAKRQNGIADLAG